MFMKKGETDPAAKEQLYKDLSECEKYMYTMIDVPNATDKFECMLFRSQFKVRFEDLLEAIKTVETACDETRNSERLRKMMATILTLVNQINTGGEGKVAAGFGLDALLKLNEVRTLQVRVLLEGNYPSHVRLHRLRLHRRQKLSIRRQVSSCIWPSW